MSVLKFIYKIVCKDLEIGYCYVGSTGNLTKRKYAHKTCCNNPNCKDYNIKLYQTIRTNGGWDNWDMVLVEEIMCDNNHQARARERYWYEKLNADLNQCRPIISNDERLERDRQNHSNRYKNDEVYREHTKQNALMYYNLKKQQEQNEQKIAK